MNMYKSQERAVVNGPPTTFFNDEFRSPICVFDLVNLITHLTQLPAGQLPPHTVYNAGGPERLSRADMAVLVRPCPCVCLTCLAASADSPA